VHDQADLKLVFPSQPLAFIRGLSFRNSGPVQGRTLDAQIALGVTSVSARTVSTVFATNLGAAPTVVLPYLTINLPAMTSTATPPPQGWTFRFSTPFPYVIGNGNLCWEMRFKNSTIGPGGMFDIASGATVIFDPLIGAGCKATGQGWPATFGGRQLDMQTGSYLHWLAYGGIRAPAALFLGDTATHIAIPGFCTALETMPLATVPGITDSGGSWVVTFTLGNLFWHPSVMVYGQFAWIDAGLQNGVGLSDCAPLMIPQSSAARVWFGNLASGQGNELALSGNRSETYPLCLVTGFEI
jgi:hypothetical protein